MLPYKQFQLGDIVVRPGHTSDCSLTTLHRRICWAPVPVSIPQHTSNGGIDGIENCEISIDPLSWPRKTTRTMRRDRRRRLASRCLARVTSGAILNPSSEWAMMMRTWRARGPRDQPGDGCLYRCRRNEVLDGCSRGGRRHEVHARICPPQLHPSQSVL